MKRTGVVLVAALSLAGLSGCGPGYETDDRGVAVEPQDLASEAEVWAAYRQISPNSNFLGGKAGLIEQLKSNCALMIEQDSGGLVKTGMVMRYDVDASIPEYLATAKLGTMNYCPEMMDDVTEAIQEGESIISGG